MTWLSPKHIVQVPRGCEGGSDLHSGQLAAAARKSEETVEELFLGHDAAGSVRFLRPSSPSFMCSAQSCSCRVHSRLLVKQESKVTTHQSRDHRLPCGRTRREAGQVRRRFGKTETQGERERTGNEGMVFAPAAACTTCLDAGTPNPTTVVGGLGVQVRGHGALQQALRSNRPGAILFPRKERDTDKRGASNQDDREPSPIKS